MKRPKDGQRSDWSRRPLREKQLSYAASDVRYLIRLAQKLEGELRKAGRLEWARAEFEALTKRRWAEREFDRLGYLRIKGARLLDPVSLAVLRELFLVRDARAREIDRPPFKVLGNRALLELAKLHPADAQGLTRVKGVTDLIIRRMGADLLKAIRKGMRRPHGPIPKLSGGNNNRRRMDRRAERRLAKLRSWRTPRARELELDPGVLCPNSGLEAIAAGNPTKRAELLELPELHSWFAESFGDEILGVLSELTGAEEPPRSSGRRKKR